MTASNTYKEPWKYNEVFDANYTEVHIGACHGLVEYSHQMLSVLAIANDKPGNGDFQSFMDTIEHEAELKDAHVQVLEISNSRLFDHLIAKRGYEPLVGLNGPAAIKRKRPVDMAKARYR